MSSIQRRLGLGLVATLLLVGLAVLQGSLWLFDNGLRNYHASNLQDEAESLLAALVHGEVDVSTGRSVTAVRLRVPVGGRP